ncbi:MAG: hypothetical protein HY692_00460 [Cyanobacteria bacterium NC_groundwater_1444_Ag_S-0.65um_54_12]|nr:hypothetical protein [Cyanobacteria bacterium NC_groundwater_1444_Ag_S-0.65um_54_12]
MPRRLAHLRQFRWSTWLISALLLTVVIGGTWYLRRRDLPRNPILPDIAVKMDPYLELQFGDVVVRGRDKGTARWEIKATEMTVSQNQRIVYFKNKPEGKFLNLKDWNDKPPEQLRNRTVEWQADSAQYDNEFAELRIAGHARFKTDEQDLMTTDQVVYRKRDHLVIIPTPVKLVSQGKKLVLKADQATADTQLEVLELSGHAQIDSAITSEGKL